MSLILQRVCFKSGPFKLLFALLLCIFGRLASHAQVSGKVFYDFDANGIQTSAGPIEVGSPNIGVRIFVDGSTQPLITQTDFEGHYAFSAQQVPAGSKARVEFFNLPETFFVSFAGPQNGTEVQFVQAPAANVNLAILNDDEFCRSGSDVKIVTACYAMGDPLKPGSAGEDPALVLFDYTASGEAGTSSGPAMEKLATASEIGSTWIASYQRSSNTLLIGAITRRHVGLGPLGTGGFYSVNLVTKAVSNFLDVKTIGINTGPDPHIDPVSGLNILPADKLARSRDSLAFHAAAKVGIGGAQLSPYQDTLFMINLYDKKLYSFKIQKPLIAPANAAEAQIKTYQIPHPGCSNNDFAPWALKYYRGKLYVGVVCTAETSQKKSDMKAAIYEFSTKTHTFRNIFEFSLNYPRGPIDATQGCDSITTWMPWTNVFPKQCNYPNGSPDPMAAFAVYPQPILSDLEFDDDGSLIIGFMDRLGLQTGQNQPGIAVNDTLNYFGFMSGDMVRAQYNANGTYTLENNGQSGSLQGCGVNTDSGPGGGEFFCEDYWISGQDQVGHAEITNGGMFKISGVPEVLVSAMDPVHKVYLSTGFIAFDTKTGKRNRSFSVYSLSPGSLGKSGGVGDLAGICEPGPLEVGNRVWIDKNRNGIQDPNEVGPDGLILTLHDMGNNGAVVGKDTTANGGQYYFNDRNVSGKLKRNHPYEVRLQTNQMVNSAVYQPSSGSAAASFVLKDSLTVTKSDTSSANALRNSDARYNSDSTQIVISFSTGDNTQNDHSEDIGLMAAIYPASVGDYAWYDLNRNGIQDLRKDPLGNILGPELPVKGVVMELRTSGSQFVKSDTTGADGKYHIGNIAPDRYYIKFNPASYPAPDFTVTDQNKGANDSLDNDIERSSYRSADFNLVSGQQDTRWDIGFFRTPTSEISDPCGCDSTILYLPGNDDFTKYVYREKVTVKATPGGKWMLIPQHIKNNITTYGLYEDDGEGYVDPIDLTKKQYFLTEVPDSLGVYEFKFAHKSADGYALAVTDGVDTLSIGAVCDEVKEHFDIRLDTLCAGADKLQLQRIFPNGLATYYLIDTTTFVFRDGFNEFTLIEKAVKRGAITELDPKNYTPNSTISLYMKWEPNQVPGQKRACQKSMILNVKISNNGDCTPPNDLELTKALVGDCRRQVGDEVLFKLIIKNNTSNLLASADSVYVKDIMPANFNFVKYVSTQGQYNTQTKQWGPLRLAAGQTDTLTLTLKINNTGGFIGGTICNEAEIVAMSKKSGHDTDSAPNNGIHTEDDYGIACVSVPLKICPDRKDTVVISAPAGYTRYQWFKNGVKIDGAAGQTLEVRSAGSYSVEVGDGLCPTKNCCPSIIEEECICPPEICMPFTTKKIKKK
ncbi:SdrD B-like domain-containing protein [Runella slithyformis]|uniref:Cna B domain protein n=1 Tax=Runella slithyformis (strain ATCC 29530 / DSM 19594 / LMG 11500 / NCIMB 11436 / LSU 4) TaxID=761193 RepID=A0A7U4E4J2_RUNSL|nr:SdrD B-like domain-containing protein [Runella slithyformis]AEI47203.1 Cna B domain protein [Runella slithyformis DSM 19594]